MNCKPGDLAVYVGREIEAHGKIVRVIKLYRSDDFGHLGNKGPSWLVEPPITHSGCNWRFVMDHALRPIRDNDGTDETLTWAPKKQPAEV